MLWERQGRAVPAGEDARGVEKPPVPKIKVKPQLYHARTTGQVPNQTWQCESITNPTRRGPGAVSC